VNIRYQEMEYLSIDYEPEVSLGMKAVRMNQGMIPIGCCPLWVCYAFENRCVVIADIPAAFLSADYGNQVEHEDEDDHDGDE